MRATAVKPSTTATSHGSGVCRRRWTRDEYYRAADLGLFRPEERLELLDGEILEKKTQKPPHAYAILRAFRVLTTVFGTGYHIRPQLPLVLNDESEPEPDLVVVVGTEDDYPRSHPTAAEARLVVEVADTTLRFDRTRKRPAYCRAGVSEYWILNLRQRCLEVYRDPAGARYLTATVHAETEVVTPLAAPSAQLAVTELLPPK